MRTVELDDANRPLSEYVPDVSQEPMIITVKGKPVAALVAIENADLETVSLSTNPDFLSLIERSRSRMRREGGLSPDEMRSRLGLAQKEA